MKVSFTIARIGKYSIIVSHFFYEIEKEKQYQ